MLPDAVDEPVDVRKFVIHVVSVELLLALPRLLLDKLVGHQEAIFIGLTMFALRVRGLGELELVECGQWNLMELGLCGYCEARSCLPQVRRWAICCVVCQ